MSKIFGNSILWCINSHAIIIYYITKKLRDNLFIIISNQEEKNNILVLLVNNKEGKYYPIIFKENIFIFKLKTYLTNLHFKCFKKISIMDNFLLITFF